MSLWRAAKAAVSSSSTTANFLLSVALVMLLILQDETEAKKKVFNVFWNTTNPMFRIDNTDNVLDVNAETLPGEYDQANIICPVYPEGTREADMERYVIYSVTREEFENCRITNPEPRIVAQCNNPNKLMWFTITFRSFTPTPGGMEFWPGQDYFFISTSSRSDISRRIGGRCSTNNMKMTLKIANKRPTFEFERTTKASVNVPRSSSDLSGGSGSSKGGLVHYEYLYPTGDDGIASNSVEHAKRSEDYDNRRDHAVEVFRLKHQAAARDGQADADSAASGSDRSVIVLSNFGALTAAIAVLLRTFRTFGGFRT